MSIEGFSIIYYKLIIHGAFLIEACAEATRAIGTL